MARTESSAINELINLVSGGRLRDEPPANDRPMFQAPRAARGTKAPPRRTRPVVAAVVAPVVAPRFRSLPVSNVPVVAPRIRSKQLLPVSTFPLPAPMPTYLPPDVADAAVSSILGASSSRSRSASTPRNERSETRPVRQGIGWLRGLLITITLLALTGGSLAGYIAFAPRASAMPGKIASPINAAAIEPVPIEAAKPVVVEVAKPAPSDQVAVRIDSTPSGATVMLVDRGVTAYLGTTPIRASVDPARSYELVLTLDGKPTKIAAFDPRATQRMVIEFEPTPEPATEPVAVPVVAPVAVAAPTHHHAKKHAKLAIAPRAATPPKAAAPVAEQGGEGVLMVSSKPPCSIVIDGSPTELMTPQRSISLTSGSHKITLINTGEHIKKTFTVQIKSGQPTKLIQDFLKAAARRATLRRS